MKARALGALIGSVLTGVIVGGIVYWAGGPGWAAIGFGILASYARAGIWEVRNP